jgi:hypothetical protein
VKPHTIVLTAAAVVLAGTAAAEFVLHQGITRAAERWAECALRAAAVTAAADGSALLAAATGMLGELTVHAEGVELPAGTVDVDAVLTEVDLRTASAGSVRVEVAVPPSLLAGRAGGATASVDDGRLVLDARGAEVVATVAARDGALVVAPETVGLGPIEVPVSALGGRLAEAARERTVSLPPLPLGLTLTDAAAEDRGVVLGLGARDVRPAPEGGSRCGAPS